MSGRGIIPVFDAMRGRDLTFTLGAYNPDLAVRP